MRARPLLYLVLLAVGLGVASGQTNIVSYAAVNAPSGFSLLANPLSAGATNGANEIGLLLDGEKILTWNGGGFDTYSYDSINGWTDGNSAPAAPPSLPPGKGFFFFNPGASTNITFTGLLIPGPGTTNRITLLPGYSLVGSSLPATVGSITSPPVKLPVIDGMLVLTWNGTGYVYSGFDSGFGGWMDADLKAKAPPSYSIGQGFFLFNPGPAMVWEQSLP